MSTDVDPVSALLSSRLSPQQLQAVELLAAGVTPSEVVAKLKINRRTLYTWQTKSEAFQNAVKQRLQDIEDARKTIRDIAAGRSEGRELNARLQAAFVTLGLDRYGSKRQKKIESLGVDWPDVRELDDTELDLTIMINQHFQKKHGGGGAAFIVRRVNKATVPRTRAEDDDAHAREDFEAIDNAE